MFAQRLFDKKDARDKAVIGYRFGAGVAENAHVAAEFPARVKKDVPEGFLFPARGERRLVHDALQRPPGGGVALRARQPLGDVEILDGEDGYSHLGKETHPAFVLDARKGRAFRALDMYRQYLRVGMVGDHRDSLRDLHGIADDCGLQLGEDDAPPPVFQQAEEIFKRKRRVRVQYMRVRDRQEKSGEAFLRQPPLDGERDLFRQKGRQDQRVDKRHVVRRDEDPFSGVFPIFPALHLHPEEETQYKFYNKSTQKNPSDGPAKNSGNSSPV
ncbi:hypothetical protein SDC9_143678 [bioreactor metagenome]|uniref:Uncharacterized protein n=1 Tax=bioreactor metagenome TaxID=1076179 RepID=A0A645E3Z9_9ZZZZ